MQRRLWLALAAGLVAVVVILGSIVLMNSARARVNFVESGLPSGTPWSVAINNATTWSSASALEVQLVPGVYVFHTAAANVSDFVAYPASGNLRIQRDDQSVSISFVRSHANVTFQETGLPQGTNWSVAEGTHVRTTNASSLTVPEPDGLHILRILSLFLPHTNNVGPVWITDDAYLASISQASLAVNGSDLSVSVQFRLALHMNWTLFAVPVFPSNTSLGAPAYDYVALTCYRYTAVNVSFHGYVIGGVTENLTAYLLTLPQMLAFRSTGKAAQYAFTTGNVSGGNFNLTFAGGTWYVVLTGWSVDEYRSANLQWIVSFPDASVFFS